MLITSLPQRVNDVSTRRLWGDELCKQSLLKVAGTGTIEEIMRDMAQIAAPKNAAVKTILYVRVGRSEQTLDHQIKQAKRAGYKVGDFTQDQVLPGIHIFLAKLSERKNGKCLFSPLREKDVLVVRWVDGLGRNYDDIKKNIRLFLDRGVTIKTVMLRW